MEIKFIIGWKTLVGGGGEGGLLLFLGLKRHLVVNRKLRR